MMKDFFDDKTFEELLGWYNHENSSNITEQQLEDIIINQINTCCALKNENESWQSYIERSIAECNNLNGLFNIIIFDDIKRAFILYLLSLYYKNDLLDKTQNIIITQLLDLPYINKLATMHRTILLNKKAYNAVTKELYDILPKYNKPQILNV